jgi:hypothetical protein
MISKYIFLNQRAGMVTSVIPDWGPVGPSIH